MEAFCWGHLLVAFFARKLKEQISSLCCLFVLEGAAHLRSSALCSN